MLHTFIDTLSLIWRIDCSVWPLRDQQFNSEDS